jgi:hypothetical protein
LLQRGWQFWLLVPTKATGGEMKSFSLVTIALALTLSTDTSVAEELSGRIVITKKLSKKLVRMPAY